MASAHRFTLRQDLAGAADAISDIADAQAAAAAVDAAITAAKINRKGQDIALGLI
jgi:hypothetical protein